MREIKFRIRYRDGKWYYGMPISQIKNNSVVFNGFDNSYYDLFADATTLGQYIGLKYKNGKEIYEGDIVKILYTDWASKSENDPRTLEEYLDSLTRLGFVYWDEMSLCYCLKFDEDPFGSIHCGKFGYIELVGNVYDNPELLNGEQR